MSDCKWARQRLALLLYGELNLDEEERVESHLDGCAECREVLGREKAMHAALDSVEVEPSPSLLTECREDLRLRLDESPAPRRIAWWQRISAAWVWRPAAALALVAIGFFAARQIPFAKTGISERVRYVEPAEGGRVQLVIDETRQRVISGTLDQAPIRGLLLAAAKDPSDPGLRVETMELLDGHAQSADIRDALIYAVEHDQNAAVRAKAIEGLAPYASEPEVRGALAKVLLADSNAGLRTEAIDLLTRGVTLDPQTVGTLQELLVRGEQPGYVRERCQSALRAVKASLETY